MNLLLGLLSAPARPVFGCCPLSPWMTVLFGSFLVATGVFSFLGGALDWEWFMSTRKAEFTISLLGRTGARIL
jgi:hypothetical protein